MALYDYRCRACDVVVTKTHSINDTPEYECETCGAVLVKSYSSPAAVFPGGGWGKDAR